MKFVKNSDIKFLECFMNNFPSFRQLIHTELIRTLWNDLDRLEEDLHNCDRGRTGFLSRDRVYITLRGCKIPIDIELLNSMLDQYV